MKTCAIQNQQTFNGKFVIEQKLSKKAGKYFDSIINTPLEDFTNKELLKKMRFNINVTCLNNTKSAIHPRYILRIEQHKNTNNCFGLIRLNEKESLQDNLKKVRKFITDASNKIKEANCRTCPKGRDNDKSHANMIIAGFFNKK